MLISGTVVCIFLLVGLTNGWFIWHTLEKPPEKVVNIIAIKGYSIWIKGSSGAIYYNETSDECQINCWVMVNEPPAELFLKEYLMDRLSTNCSPVPPLIGAIESMAECRRDTWVDYDSLYVLRWDGKLVSWHFSYGGEYGFLWNFCFSFIYLGMVFYVGVMIDKWIRMSKIPKNSNEPDEVLEN
jgi:hypothetical protein